MCKLEELEQKGDSCVLFDAISAVESLDSENVVKAFEEILAKGVDVNAKNEKGETPLIAIINLIPTSGCKEGQYYKMIDLLLKDDKLDVNLQDSHERTALDLAILYLFGRIIDLLLDHKSMVYNTVKKAVQLPVQSDYAEIIKEKIKNCQLYKEGSEEYLREQEYKWYIIQVLPRYEQRVCNSILDPTRKLYPFFVKNALVPFVEDMEKKKTLLYSCYVFVHMKLCDESLKIIKNMEGVLRFLGGNKPKIVNDDEINTMLNNLDRNELCSQSKQKYEIGEFVAITQGAFKGFYGELQYVNYERGIVRINAKVFNHTSPIEVKLDQIERKD